MINDLPELTKINDVLHSFNDLFTQMKCKLFIVPYCMSSYLDRIIVWKLSIDPNKELSRGIITEYFNTKAIVQCINSKQIYNFFTAM